MAEPMDIGESSSGAAHKSGGPRAIRSVSLASDTPLDTPWLDNYASLHSGRRKVLRMLFIARSCPQLALEAYAHAIKEIQEQTFDTQAYEQAVQEYNARPESSGKKWQVDEAWLDKTRRHVADQTDKLQVELKNYQTNLIKESIRMAHRDIGAFEHKCGDLQNALRTYLKSRDFATATNQIFEACLTIIDVALDMQNYAFIRNYVVKAEAAYDTIFSGPSAAAQGAARSVPMPGVSGGGANPAHQRAVEAEDKRKSLMADRVAVASGVAELGSGNYSRAARKLLNLGAASRDADAGHFISSGDIALYGVLCALATFDRGALKRQVIDNTNLRPLLELEPQLKDIVSSFYANDYKSALDLLQRYEPRHLLDIHLSPHIDSLIGQIRARAVVQYFAPFSTASLSRMASAFGWAEGEMEAEVVRLIGKKELKARIDSRAKVVHAFAPSQRAALFKHAIEAGHAQDAAARALLLRMNLIAQDVVVRPPKTQQQPPKEQTEGSPNKQASKEQQNGVISVDE